MRVGQRKISNEHHVHKIKNKFVCSLDLTTGLDYKTCIKIFILSTTKSDLLYGYHFAYHTPKLSYYKEFR